MAKIRNRKIVQNAIDQLGLQREMERVPEEILTKVVPVFNMDRKPILDLVLKTGNLANYTISIPENETWEIESMNILVTTTATVGNRALRIILRKNGYELWRTLGDQTIAASQTDRANNFAWFCGTTETNVSGLNSIVAFPKWIPGGTDIIFDDRAGVDEANDVIEIAIIYRKHERQE